MDQQESHMPARVVRELGLLVLSSWDLGTRFMVRELMEVWGGGICANLV